MKLVEKKFDDNTLNPQDEDGDTDAAWSKIVFKDLTLAQELEQEEKVEVFTTEGWVGYELDGVHDVEWAYVVYGYGKPDDSFTSFRSAQDKL